MTVAELILALRAMPDKDVEVVLMDEESGSVSLVYAAECESHAIGGLWETFVVIHAS